MVSWLGNRLSINTREWTSVARGFGVPVRWDPILQVGIAGLVGLFLGLYVLVFRSLPSKWALLSLPIMLAPFAAMVFGQVRKLLLAAIILDIPLQLDINLAHREQVADLGAIEGLNVSLTTMALAVLYVLWLAEFLGRPPGARSRSALRTSLPLAFYLGFSVLSIVAAQDVQLSTFKIFMLAQMFLLYTYIVSTVRTRQDVLFIVAMLLIGLALESLVMIGLRVTGSSIDAGVVVARIDDGARVGGTVGGPNTAAGYLCLLLAPAMSVLLTQLGRFYKWLAALAFGLGVIAMFFTLSRGGWIALALSIIVLCLLAWYRGWLSPTLLIIISIVALLLVVFFQGIIVERLFGDDDGSADSRVPLMMVAYRMIMDNLVSGVGANNFSIVMMQYAQLGITGFWFYVVHNKYLLVWAEIGTAGFAAFIWFLLASIRRGWQGWRFKDHVLSPLALGFAVAILGHAVHMFFDTFQNRPLVQLLWLNAALITAIYNIGKNELAQGAQL